MAESPNRTHGLGLVGFKKPRRKMVKMEDGKKPRMEEGIKVISLSKMFL